MATAVIEAHVVQNQQTATTTTASSSSGHSARLIRHAESTEDSSPIGHVVGSLYDKWGTSSLKDYIVDDQNADRQSIRQLQTSGSVPKRLNFGTFPTSAQSRVTRPPPVVIQSEDEGSKLSLTINDRPPIDLRDRPNIFTKLNQSMSKVFDWFSDLAITRWITYKTLDLYSACAEGIMNLINRKQNTKSEHESVPENFDALTISSAHSWRDERSADDENASLVEMLK